jgi:hypothetical protein
MDWNDMVPNTRHRIFVQMGIEFYSVFNLPNHANYICPVRLTPSTQPIFKAHSEILQAQASGDVHTLHFLEQQFASIR